MVWLTLVPPPSQGGRELAEVSRPNTKEPPIMIMSGGTVF